MLSGGFGFWNGIATAGQIGLHGLPDGLGGLAVQSLQGDLTGGSRGADYRYFGARFVGSVEHARPGSTAVHSDAVQCRALAV